VKAGSRIEVTEVYFLRWPFDPFWLYMGVAWIYLSYIMYNRGDNETEKKLAMFSLCTDT
jgi:hypothetical protein